MATFTVTTASDVVSAGDGVLSLREAVAQANATAAADTILFAAGLEGQTLQLTGGQLAITRDLTIDGDANNDGSQVGLDAGGLDRHFAISGAATDVALRDLVLATGRAAGDGGAVSVTAARVTLEECGIFSSYASGSGGAVAVAGAGALTIVASRLGVSTAVLDGGAVAASGGSTLVARGSTFNDNAGYRNGGAVAVAGGSLTLEDSIVRDNLGGKGGGILVQDASALIQRSSIHGNATFDGNGGGLYLLTSATTIVDTTVAGNVAQHTISPLDSLGGGIHSILGGLTLRNATITGNRAVGSPSAYGGGVKFDGGTSGGVLDVANTIIAGNRLIGSYVANADDLQGTIDFSNGHNIFGSAVTGEVAGDRESIAGSALFATIDPVTGGGVVGADGTVALRNNAANPALGGADPLAANATDQVGAARPLPADSLPDIGAAERGQTLSTTASANNDRLTGTAAANTINAQAGHDFVRGLGGTDTLNGGDGGDVLDGGAGNDRLNGNAGIDLATFASGAAAVTVDLSGTTDTARRGTETDTLTGIEGAIGSAAGDTFRGDAAANLFQGGLGKDTATGGAGRDLYDFNTVAESGVGTANRDVITDFAHLADKLDLMGIDADAAIAGNQAFRFVGTAALTGAGQAGFFTSGGNTIVRLSTDADAASEAEIQLTGIVALTAQDFYL